MATRDGIYRELSVYPRSDRPKETFNCVAGFLPNREGIEFLDVGCASGALIEFIASSHLTWNFVGIDITPHFIEDAKSRSIPRSKFIAADFRGLSAQGDFDVVTCIGTLPMFDDFSSSIYHILNFCRDGGRIIVDGFFNKYDLEMRVKFRKDAEDDWHIGFNHFSRSSVSRALAGKCRQFSFHDIPFRVDIPPKPGFPTYAWTEPGHPNRRLTNGLGLALNTTMLVIDK